MKIAFATAFENMIKGYFEYSILKRAIDNGILTVDFVNPFEYSEDKFNRVDSYIAGGGAGMIFNVKVLSKLIEEYLGKDQNTYVVFPLPAAKRFDQKDAVRLSKKSSILFVCGRYEGIDERVIEYYADEVLSIGDFVLTGGELASVVMSDAICRNIRGVLGNESSLLEESFNGYLLEAPSFAKPQVYKGLSFPSEFLKGNHGKIASLKKSMSIDKTRFYRPDLYEKYQAKEKR